MEILAFDDYLTRLLAGPRPGKENILAFYEHRIGAICKDPRLLFAPLDDHMCHRGDGVFESISYRNRHIFHLDAHLDRMRNSLERLKITPPCSFEELRSIIMAVAKAGDEDDGSLRILLGRGPGGFGIAPTECPVASLYVVALRARKTVTEAWYAKGLTACKSAIPAKQPYLAQMKSVNYVPNVLMADEAIERQVNIVFSFTEEGYLAEAAIANVAIVTADGVLASPFFTHALPGTTLLAALDAAKDFMPTKQCNITEEDIFNAKEVLLFSSTPLCVGVTHYEGRPIADGCTGPVSRLLRQRLSQGLMAEGVAF